MTDPSRPKRILFLCVANSARSQLAEGLAKNLFGLHAIVESAGSKPSGIVHPMAVAVMNEIGLDIARQKSKAVEDLPPDFLNTLNISITLCSEEVCPDLPNRALRLHWPLPDPAAVQRSEMEEEFRFTRDQIRNLLIELGSKLGIPPAKNP